AQFIILSRKKKIYNLPKSENSWKMKELTGAAIAGRRSVDCRRYLVGRLASRSKAVVRFFFCFFFLKNPDHIHISYSTSHLIFFFIFLDWAWFFNQKWPRIRHFTPQALILPWPPCPLRAPWCRHCKFAVYRLAGGGEAKHATPFHHGGNLITLVWTAHTEKQLLSDDSEIGDMGRSAIKCLNRSTIGDPRLRSIYERGSSSRNKPLCSRSRTTSPSSTTRTIVSQHFWMLSKTSLGTITGLPVMLTRFRRVPSRYTKTLRRLTFEELPEYSLIDGEATNREWRRVFSAIKLDNACVMVRVENLINILAEVSQTGKQRHIPYRDSKLTFLLQESLGGNAKLAMICAISPSQSCKSETLSTLRFAQRAKAIKNKAVINEEMQEDVNVLREVIRQLRDELHRMKANNHDQTGLNGAYATGWNAKRSLTLLRFSLNRPMMPITEDDSDEEMEIVDADEEILAAPEEKCLLSPEQGFGGTDVNIEDKAVETVEKDKSSVIGDGLMGRHGEMFHESRSKIVHGNDDCIQSEDEECTSSDSRKLPGSDLSKKPMEQRSLIQLSAGTVNTSEKSTNCIEDGQASGLSIVPINLPLVLKFPAPSVSPKPNSCRKSLRASSTVTASQSFPTQSNLKAVRASMAKPSSSNLCLYSLSNRNSCFASTGHLAETLHRGLEIIESQRLSPVLRRSSFRFSCMPKDVKAVIPAAKVDVGVQTIFYDDELMDNGTMEQLCSKCKTMTDQQGLLNDDAQNLQLVPVNGSPSNDMCHKQVPKAVEKVLAGAIRREMALEEMCAKQNYEIIQLTRLAQQYKHERECNSIIGQIREGKIARLERLMDGILPTEEFMEEELVSLTDEHKILQEQYDNHPDVLRTKIELKRIRDELERYQNFFDLGERDVLLEELQDLRTQLQSYLDSSGKTSKRQTPLLELTTSHEPGAAASTYTTNSGSIDNAKERLGQERIQWTEAESKWISLVEELKTELEANRSTVQRQKQELDIEKKCSEELKEAMQMAMEGHARMLEQYAELEEKHIQLLARHRNIQDGIDDVKEAAAKAGVRGAESKFINALAAEISVLKVEREKERRYFRDENKGLQAQLRDTAEAVQAAGELLVRLKEAEEVVAAAERRAVMAEHETESAYKEIENLNSLLAVPHLPKEEFAADRNRGSTDEHCGEKFAPSYGVAEEPSSWFSGYDRCNV
ncbi:Kinesin-like protein KIN12B, partial [Striga hermonthica]